MNLTKVVRYYTTLSIAAVAYVFSCAYDAHIVTLRHKIFVGQFIYFVTNRKDFFLFFFNMFLVSFFWFGKLIQVSVFGKLRDIESQNLGDRLAKFAMSKLIFISLFLEPNIYENAIWITWFTLLGFLRTFAMLCKDRFEFLMYVPSASSLVHVRIFGLLMIILSFICGLIIGTSLVTYKIGGLSIIFLLNFESITLLLDCIQTAIKYSLHLSELSLREFNFLENKESVLYNIEFYTETFIDILTLLHYFHILIIHGLQFSLIDFILAINIRSVYYSLKKKIGRYRDYRLISRDLEMKYESATPQELVDYNDHCAICRELMKSAKKMPCGHLFHVSCLRSWLHHHNSCPTCRRSLLKSSTAQISPNFDQSNQFNYNNNNSSNNNIDNNNLNAATMTGPRNSVFRFNGRRWATWLPSFSVEFRAQHLPRLGQVNSNRQLIQHLSFVFGVSENLIESDLQQTGSIEQTTDNLAEGRLVRREGSSRSPPDPPPAPTPAGASASSAVSIDQRATLQQLSEIFRIPMHIVEEDFRLTNSIEETTENLLAGRYNSSQEFINDSNINNSSSNNNSNNSNNHTSKDSSNAFIEGSQDDSTRTITSDEKFPANSSILRELSASYPKNLKHSELLIKEREDLVERSRKRYLLRKED